MDNPFAYSTKLLTEYSTGFIDGCALAYGNEFAKTPYNEGFDAGNQYQLCSDSGIADANAGLSYG